MLTFFANSTEIHFGGLTHRGKRTYTLESLGCFYIIFWIVLIIADFKIIAPVLNGNVHRVGSD